MKILRKIKKISLTKSCKSNKSSSTSSSSCSGSNYGQQLTFHPVHGENIRLSNDYQFAKRSESYCDGIVFSNRPIKINERISIKCIESSSLWSGALRFGFTNVDPQTLRNCLPKFACPVLTSQSGFWAKALNERYSASENVLTYWVDEAGKVHYAINGEFKGIYLVDVDVSQPLWALLDIYGYTSAIQFIGSSPAKNQVLKSKQVNTLHRQSVPSIHSNNTINRNISMRRSKSIENDYMIPLSMKESPLKSPFNVKESTYKSNNYYSNIDARIAPIYYTINRVNRDVNQHNIYNSNKPFKSDCTVCYEKPINCALYTCGHLCMCYDCACKQWKRENGGRCPICRARIMDVIRTYYV